MMNELMIKSPTEETRRRAAAVAAPLLADPALLNELQDTVLQLLAMAIARTRNGETCRSAADARSLCEYSPATTRPAAAANRGLVLLSPREREVLQRLAEGDSNKLIARALHLSPHTVKRHVANILDKLAVASRGQAAACWLTQQR